MTDSDRDAMVSIELTKLCGQILTGHPENVLRSAHSQLLAKFIVGHHPLLRIEAMNEILKAVDMLIPEYDSNLTASGRRPPDWPPDKRHTN